MFNFTKIILAFLVFFIFSACTPSQQEIPKVIDNRIYFLDNITQIEVGARDIIHIFISQGRVVHISEQMLSNHLSQYQMIIFDFMGNEISHQVIHGVFSFIFAEKGERILAASALMQWHDKSFLYDLDGNLLNVLQHDLESKQAGITNDERYFWFAANRMRPLYAGEEPFFPGWDQTPYNHIMVFSVYTGDFIESFSTHESDFTFTINERVYSITVSPPDIPG